MKLSTMTGGGIGEDCLPHIIFHISYFIFYQHQGFILPNQLAELIFKVDTIQQFDWLVKRHR